MSGTTPPDGPLPQPPRLKEAAAALERDTSSAAAAAQAAPPPSREPRRVVLIGAGHTHLLLVHWWGRRPIPGVDLILINAFDRFAYSGMVPGAIAGLYPFADVLVDLPALCERCRVTLVVDRVVRLNSACQTIDLAHQPPLSFDVASVNIGSVPSAEFLCQTHRMLVGLKPLATLGPRLEGRLRELLTQHREAGRTDLMPVAIVGGGAAGVELALCLDERAYRAQWPLELMIVEGGGDVLPGHSRSARRRVRRLLKQRGIEVYFGRRVVGCHEEGPSALVLDDGSPLLCELALWATGTAPPRVLEQYDLPKTPRGFLAVNPTLQSTAEVPVFAAGDVADVFGRPVPKAGVYAVREAKILWNNLHRLLAGQPLLEYHPQRSFLSLMTCGDGTALLDYHGFACRSRWAWWLKCWIDRRFVRQFQR
jgi:selenide,water dikinase